MIMSNAHKFVFFHNPKAAGTSVREALEKYNDIGFKLWGPNPDQTKGRMIDRAHIGLDEFAEYFPELWDRAKGYHKFFLYRDPFSRFFSSFAEYSKHYGEVDMRFSTSTRRISSISKMISRLEEIGTA
jgi:hypothetical protein